MRVRVASAITGRVTWALRVGVRRGHAGAAVHWHQLQVPANNFWDSSELSRLASGPANQACCDVVHDIIGPLSVGPTPHAVPSRKERNSPRPPITHAQHAPSTTPYARRRSPCPSSLDALVSGRGSVRGDASDSSSSSGGRRCGATVGGGARRGAASERESRMTSSTPSTISVAHAQTTARTHGCAERERG